jgi:hypothetical protein
MDENRSIIEQDVNTLVFYMNGGLPYNDAWLLTQDQRRNMGNVIKKHFEAQNPKSKQQL